MSIVTKFGDLWPATEKPQNDELLSSWVYWIARNHGLSLHDFGYRIWGHLQVTGDIDNYYSERIINKLSTKTIYNFDQIHNLTLKSFEGILFDNFKPKQLNPWILVNRTSKNYNNPLVYCPKCFKKDGERPYLRKKWRLSLSIICLHCNSYLMDNCPNCQNGYWYLKREYSAIYNLSFCPNCKFNFTKNESEKADDEIIRIQKTLNQFIDDKYWNSNENNPYPSLLEVIHHLLPLIYTDKIRVNYFPKNEVLPPRNKKFRPSFYLLDLNVREILLRKVFYLLDNWPYIFIEIILKSPQYNEETFNKLEDAPYWYSSICKELLCHD